LAIATDMSARDVSSVAVIAEAGAYGEGLFETFNETYDGFVRLDTFRDANQRAQAIVSAGASGADEVLFIASAQSDVELFLRNLESNAPYDDKGIFLTDSAATQSVLGQTPVDVVPRVRGTRPSQLTVDDFVYGVFRSSYRAEYDADVGDFSFAAHSYDAAWITMLGIAWAELAEGRVTGPGIARGARHLSEGTPTDLSPSKWLGAVQSFREGTGVNVRGTSGELDYASETEETSAPIDVWSLQLEDGTPVLTVIHD
jgi:branched-chain amino acid transport system substrate-binding protein